MSDLKIMIVDDSVVYLHYLEELLNEFPNVTIVGKANDGAAALDLIPKTNPDLITLDVEMPILNGVECLRQIRKRWPETVTLMVSAHRPDGASVTMECLSLGAFDFLTKPDMSDPNAAKDYLRRQLRNKINMVRVMLNANRIVARQSARILKAVSLSEVVQPPQPTPRFSSTKRPIECVGIGISTGGPEALRQMLPLLPNNLRVPILIVQHMPSLFTKALAESLDKRSGLHVKEAEDLERIRPGTVYIAPGDRHLRVEREEKLSQVTVRITQDPPENHCRPSVDYLFRSMAQVYQDAAMAIVMTGMGSDGAQGVRLIARRGGLVTAQNKETSTIFGMPAEAIKTGVVQNILPLNEIALHIQTMTARRRTG